MDSFILELRILLLGKLARGRRWWGRGRWKEWLGHRFLFWFLNLLGEFFFFFTSDFCVFTFVFWQSVDDVMFLLFIFFCENIWMVSFQKGVGAFRKAWTRL